MLAIYRKEIKSYFTSIIGYLFIGFFLAFIGLYHYVYNLGYGAANLGYAFNGVTMFFVLLVPMLTMRIMAEENKQKTDQLLLTSPISISRIIIGKYLALISIFGIVILFTCIYPPVMANFGTVNFKMSYASIFGFFLLGAAYMAIGLFISAMTESQAFAAVLTFIVVLITCLIDGIAAIMPTDNTTAWITFAILLLIIAALTYVLMKNILISVIIFFITEVGLAAVYLFNPTALDGSIINVFGWLSVIARFDNFTVGIVDLSSVVYYLSMTGLFVFLTIQVIKKRRWS